MSISIYNLFTQSSEISDVLKSIFNLSQDRFSGAQHVTLRLYALRVYESAFDSEGHEMQEYDSQFVKLFDVELGKRFLNHPEDNDLMKQLIDHLYSLYVATDNQAGLQMYDTTELLKIISGKINNYDKIRFLHSLRQSIYGKNRHEKAMYIVEVLRLNGNSFNLSRQQALQTMLMLDIAWKALSGLPQSQQQLLLENFFYYSIVLGVPVREALHDALYATTSAVEFAKINFAITQFLRQNNELILIGGQKQSYRTIFEQYSKESKNFFENTSNQQQFVNKLLRGSQNASVENAWLFEAINLQVGIESAHLIKNNLGGEPTEWDAYQDEVARLLVYFFNKEEWPKFIAYYKQTNPVVSLKNVVEQLVRNLDLNKQMAIGMLLDFNTFLLENNVISVDLILFSESDNQFHWNEEILK